MKQKIKMISYLQYIYKTYINRQMLVLMALGFSSGFPFLLVFGTLSFWLKEIDISLKLIGIFSLVKLPYSLKWLWSPLIDNIKLPVLNKLGRRRSWAVLIQIMLFISIVLMSITDPQKHTLCMALFALLTCFLSASQDIVLDAFRVESFTDYPEKQASGVAIYVLGYRLGLIFSGAGAIYLASIMNWSQVYIIMACGIFVGLSAILYTSEPQKYTYTKYKFEIKDSIKFLKNSIIKPFNDFMSHRYWGWIIVLIFTYHLSNAYFNPMMFPFYIDMGFSKTEIAYVLKIYGMIAAIIGGLSGGIIVMKIGLKKSMIYFGILQCLSTLLFSLQAAYGHNIPLFIIIVTVENFCSGLATTALVAYISSLCNKLYTATQYAILSSIMSISRDVFSSTSGFVAEHVSWEMFFVISALMSLPSILIILLCMRQERN